MSGMEIAEFLLARIAADEEAARFVVGRFPAPFRSAWMDANGAHAWNDWQPSRVLAECEAKRRIVEECRAADTMLGDRVLRLLALPYVDHPDYDPAWRV